MNKKIITALIVIVVVAALFFAANWIVNNIDIVRLLKQLHGG